MTKTSCVWFRNKLTGKVDGVPKGSEAHKRMTVDALEDDDGVPFLVWEEIKAPKVGTTARPKAGGLEPGKFYGEHREPVKDAPDPEGKAPAGPSQGEATSKPPGDGK